MGFKDHFSGHAADYARFRPSYPAELFSVLAELCAATDLAWDCACGNGQASAALAGWFGQVVATDASRQQIHAAPAIEGVTFRVAAAESSGLETHSADLVTVAQSLHWFDTARFYAEARRVLKPNGILCAWAYGVCHVNAEIDQLVRRLYVDLTGPYWPAERRHIEARYETLDFPGPRLSLPSFEMQESWLAEDMLGYLSTWSAVHRYRTNTGRDPLAEIAEALCAAWGAGPRAVRWPLSVLATRFPPAQTITDTG